MKRCSDRLALAAGCALAVLVGAGMPNPARAQATVACVNCATAWTQLMQQADQARQLATQLQQRATQLQQYSNQIQNTVALPYQVWGAVQGEVMQVRNLANAASVLSGNAGGMVSRLNAASGYAGQASNLANVGSRFDMWQQTIGNNVTTLGRTLGLQDSQQQTNAALIERMQAQSGSATGQMQAIQAGNQLASATAGQLLQIQATLAATAQMQAGNAVVAADRQAAEDAAMRAFTARTPLQTTGNPRY